MSWLPKTSVVVPVDFSDQSVQALETAVDLVERPSQIHVVHVLLPASHVADAPLDWRSADEATRKHHATMRLRERLADERYRHVSITVEVGDPGHKIAEFAESRGAELIVMPCHGRTGIKRLLIGSVAERVVRLAHCPVLVLRS